VRFPSTVVRKENEVKIFLQYVGKLEGLGLSQSVIEWPDNFPLPGLGHHLSIPNVHPNLVVDNYFWYPLGSVSLDEPHVWIYLTDNDSVKQESSNG
jgi:hypothetical protein